MTKRSTYAFCGMAAVFAVAAAAAPARAITTYGTLSNFDAVNDTGQVCNGFRIELDGISTTNVTYTFGTPYNRYGTPTVTDIPGGGGVYVEYAATWSGSAWSMYTPAATTAITTGGHQFWTGGDPNYPLKGPNGGVPGDHFGLGLTANPTKTVYQWLSGNTAGQLNVVGTSINLPAPIVTAQAPNNAQAPAAVQVVVQAPPAPVSLFGTPIWVKVFFSDGPAEPVPLEDLVVGNAAVNNNVEFEWLLLQKGYAGHESLDSGLNDLNQDAQSFVQRYEFYKYNPVAGFDGDGQALVDAPGDLSNPWEVGSFIGSNIVALNLAALPVPEPASLGVLAVGAVGLLLRRRRA